MEVWECNIERVSNGFILSYVDENGVQTEVFTESKDMDFGMREALKDVFYSLIDYFGESGSRYDRERIRINLERGDKYLDGGTK